MAPSSSEIKDAEDLECGLMPTCRICFECDGEEDEDLISPCMCKGSHLFVHRSCLDNWRSIKRGFDFSHCTTCKAQFHLRVVEFEENVWRKIKIRLFIARDIIFAFLALQTVFGILGGLIYLADKHKYIPDVLNGDSNTILLYYCMGVLVFFQLLGSIGLSVYVIMNDSGEFGCCHMPRHMNPLFWLYLGILFCLTLVTFAACGIMVAMIGACTLIQWIMNRHSSIIAKKELTKEYVVEDLHGYYTPALLDPKHLERLKALKLF